MSTFSAVILAVFGLLLVMFRAHSRGLWRRTREVTAEPAWHEQWLGRRREPVTNLADLNPDRALPSLGRGGAARDKFTVQSWHEQWLEEESLRSSPAVAFSEAALPFVDVAFDEADVAFDEADLVQSLDDEDDDEKCMGK